MAMSFDEWRKSKNRPGVVSDAALAEAKRRGEGRASDERAAEIAQRNAPRPKANFGGVPGTGAIADYVGRNVLGTEMRVGGSSQTNRKAISYGDQYRQMAPGDQAKLVKALSETANSKALPPARRADAQRRLDLILKTNKVEGAKAKASREAQKAEEERRSKMSNVEKASEFAKNLPTAIASMPRELIKQGVTFTENVGAALPGVDSRLEKLMKMRQDGEISQSTYEKLLVGDESRQGLLQRAGMSPEDSRWDTFLKAGASFGETLADAATLGTAGAAVKGGKTAVKGRRAFNVGKEIALPNSLTARGALEGATGGVLGGVREDPSLQTALTGGVTGAIMGGSLAAAGTGINRLLEGKTKVIDPATVADTADYNKTVLSGADPADVARLKQLDDQLALINRKALPENAGVEGPNIATTGDNFIFGASDIDPKAVKRMAQIDKKLDAYQQGKIKDPKGAEVRALKAERETISQNLRVKSESRLEALQAERDALAAKIDNTPTLADNPYKAPERVVDPATGQATIPAAARKTEQRAIEAGLIEDGLDIPTAGPKMNMEEQYGRAAEVFDQDYDAGLQMALTAQGIPEGLQPSVVYKMAEFRAAQAGDAVALSKLVSESPIPRMGTEAGRLSKGFDDRSLVGNIDGNPAKVMKNIVNAREKAKLPKVISAEEADKIMKMTQDLQAKKDAFVASGSDADRIAWGEAVLDLNTYETALKDAAKKGTTNLYDKALEASGTVKSLVSSMDISAGGRQLYKLIANNPVIWTKTALKQFVDVAKELGGKDAKRAVAVDIITRPNLEMYRKMKLDVLGITEEAFPSTLPEKIPGLGRLYKASDSAYTNALHRARADLADKFLREAENAGIDLTDKYQLENIGHLVNSMTGRGNLGSRLDKAAPALNNVFFSPRLFKSNIDFLTAHTFQGLTKQAPVASKFVRKKAAANLLRSVGLAASVLYTAEQMMPGSVEKDPRSSNFGKIKVGNTRFDVTGGMSSIATLATRIAMQSTKSGTTDVVSELNSGEFGSQTALDVLWQFAQGKASPVAGVGLDFLRGQTFTGEKPTVTGEIAKLITPITVANYNELRKDPNSANKLVTVIADGLGFATNTYEYKDRWDTSTTKEMQGFKAAVAPEQFKEANDRFNKEFNDWYRTIQSDPELRSLPAKDQKQVFSKKRDELKDQIFKDYGFEMDWQDDGNPNKDKIKELVRR